MRDEMAARLLHKRALIVGGTTGLGLAAARRFLEEGAHLLIASPSADSGAAGVGALETNGPVTFVPCDAADGAQVDRLFARTIEQLGGLDVLYHVAGISGRRQ